MAACGGDSADSAWTGTVADSAGIPVVNNPAEGMWAEGEGWTVVEDLSIGSLEGDLAYQFGQIGGVDADGNVYITDAQTLEIRVFDGTGAYVRAIGAPGGGPGEFGRLLGSNFVVGDELVVPDLGNMRVSRFTPDGDFIASEQIDLAKGVPQRMDMTSGGRLIAQFATLALGPPGSVWVQNVHSGNELAGEEGTFDVQDLASTECGVFDNEGRYLGAVTFPGKRYRRREARASTFVPSAGADARTRGGAARSRAGAPPGPGAGPPAGIAEAGGPSWEGVSRPSPRGSRALHRHRSHHGTGSLLPRLH